MTNINEILARAAALRDETALNSIDPERAGGIMCDTLLALNELWLQQGAALVISKIYASVAAMEADSAPVSDLTGQPLRPGQIVVIASSDSDNGSVYRYDGTEDDTSSWSLVGTIGGIPVVDGLDSDSATLSLAARQGKVLDGKISQLQQEYLEALFRLSSCFNPTSEDSVETITTAAKVTNITLSANKEYFIHVKGSISVFTTPGVVLYYRYVESGSPVYAPLFTTNGATLAEGFYIRYTPTVDGLLAVRSYTEGDTVNVSVVKAEVDAKNVLILGENYSEVGAITYNEYDVMQSCSVIWADGTVGVFTATDWDDENYMYRGYTITYGSTLILTQPAVTVINGIITNVPQKTISAQQ